MNKALPVITESPQDLQRRLRAEPTAPKRQRLQALYLLASGHATSRGALAAHFHLLVLDNGAFHKAHSLRRPPNVGRLFLSPYAPEVNPIERLWRDLKDWLTPRQPPTLDALSALLTTRLRHSSPTRLRSLTGFPILRRGCPPR